MTPDEVQLSHTVAGFWGAFATQAVPGAPLTSPACLYSSRSAGTGACTWPVVGWPPQRLLLDVVSAVEPFDASNCDLWAQYYGV
jgi:hypothetical protein